MSIYLGGNPSSRQVVAETKDTTQAVVKNTIAAYDTTSGLVIPATSSTVRRSVAGIFMDTITAGQALASANVENIIENAEYSIDTTNNSDVAHNGQAMVLTSAGVANNTGTTSASGIVVQVGVLGSASDKKIKVRFVTSV